MAANAQKQLAESELAIAKDMFALQEKKKEWGQMHTALARQDRAHDQKEVPAQPLSTCDAHRLVLREIVCSESVQVGSCSVFASVPGLGSSCQSPCSLYLILAPRRNELAVSSTLLT